ncbi:MAG: amino acid deaminase [Frankiales bacterium]|nr:amino acid deaminase [Frankiales bacterium]
MADDRFAATYDDAAVRALRLQPFDARTKGIPSAWWGRTTEAIAAAGHSVLELPTPTVTIDSAALAHNLTLMAQWCAGRDVHLAPHGKTTMAPQLFARQLQLGAWGITAATAAQVAVMRSVAISRIVLANQLVDPVALAWIGEETSRDPGFDFYCYVDSVRGVELMDAALRDARATRPLNVLIEVGRPGGRAGCRSLDEALAVAAAVASTATLTLAGVGGYEGSYAHDLTVDAIDAVEGFLREMRRTVGQLASRRYFDGLEHVVVSAGGSAYFDQVVDVLTERWDVEQDVVVVLRSGAYATHDDGHYKVLSPFGRPGTTGPAFLPALHAWSRVLSRPEPRLAILDAGKRDVSYDLGLPVPQRIRRADGTTGSTLSSTVTAVNDQHTFLSLDPDLNLEVGDVVRLGLSHPCTVFDKWQSLPVIDNDDRVVDVIRTFF